MIKTLALMRRKDGISHEEFVQHYEEVHAPLSIRVLPWLKHYVRNHITQVFTGQDFGFDCISQFWFDSLEDSVKLMEFVQSDEGVVIREDEHKFLDSNATTPFLVEEKASDIEAEDAGPNSFKAIALLKRKPGISRIEFGTHYEHNHAPLIISRSSGLIRYFRNYVVSLDEATEPLYDCITELWFKDQAAYEATMSKRMGDARSEIEADEKTFLDMERVVFLVVDERISK